MAGSLPRTPAIHMSILYRENAEPAVSTPPLDGDVRADAAVICGGITVLTCLGYNGRGVAIGTAMGAAGILSVSRPGLVVGIGLTQPVHVDNDIETLIDRQLRTQVEIITRIEIVDLGMQVVHGALEHLLRHPFGVR